MPFAFLSAGLNWIPEGVTSLGWGIANLRRADSRWANEGGSPRRRPRMARRLKAPLAKADRNEKEMDYDRRDSERTQGRDPGDGRLRASRARAAAEGARRSRRPD